jgi:cell division protein ZapA (FtsZ GTPase activity inhibitor)
MPADGSLNGSVSGNHSAGLNHPNRPPMNQTTHKCKNCGEEWSPIPHTDSADVCPNCGQPTNDKTAEQLSEQLAAKYVDRYCERYNDKAQREPVRAHIFAATKEAIQSATQPLERRIEELTAELTEAKLPTLKEVQGIYAMTERDELRARVKQLEGERDAQANLAAQLDEKLRDAQKAGTPYWSKLHDLNVLTLENDRLTAENAELRELVQWIRNVATGDHQIPDCMCDTEALGHIAGKIDQAKDQTDKR